MSELDEQRENRRRKGEELREAGFELHPYQFEYDLEPTRVHQRYGDLGTEALETKGVDLRIPGRVRAIRGHGKVQFLDLGDGDGKLQLFVRRPQVSEEVRFLLDRLDIGDLVGASGTLMRTRAGELSLMMDDLVLLSKCLRPLPEKWHGLTDVEARYRQRYLDLIVNPESREVFQLRSRLVREIRRFFDDRGFLEVETPMMHQIPGGATARPFVTHHNALDLDLYLRIAPELYLKRLLVGGFPRVYEINRNFRNEGISTQHNPEFTMLELYWAWADYVRMMEMTEELLVTLEKKLLPETGLRWQGRRLDLERSWPRMTIREALEEIAGIDRETTGETEGLRTEHESRGIPLPETETYGHLLMNLFETLVEEELQNPTFILDFPVEVSPLAKVHREDPRFVERFELFAGGMELANAFSELNDPEVQEERFRNQLEAREVGDEEAWDLDGDYLRALEVGMPPAAGIGIGIDRLAMLFADRQSIRDVILFPLLRPEGGEEG
ncbi:MAG: lysine--tRNA ligase [Thermoanaerobaculia bacterium]|nr:lysine--tRNA ligase [Thermoanaerobaculia bacterium]